MAIIDENGITIERLDEIVARFNSGFRQIYGQNINLDPDTPDGQMIGILSQIKMDFEELAENVYKQLDPDLATGAWLEQRVAYAGLVRRGASYSYLRSAIITGTPNVNLYAGIVVSDGNKVRWVLERDVTLNQLGSAQADFRSEELGAFNLPPKTALTIETVTLGLQSVTSNEAAEEGSEEETDTELRQRFFISRSKNAQNSVDALEAKIHALPDVKQVKVLENNSGALDKNGVQPHSINVVVVGGNSRDIAKAIYDNKGAGVGLQGETQVMLTIDNLQRNIKFDYAAPVDIAVQIRVVRYEDFTEIDQAELKRVLTGLVFAVGAQVSISRLYSPINTVGGFWVKDFKIGRKGQMLAASNIKINPREVARILESDIAITVE